MKTEKPQADADQTKAAENFDKAAEDVAAKSSDMQLGELRGDMRDLVLELFKRRPKPWDQMLEEEQTDVASAVERFCETVLDSVVTLVASKGLQTVSAVVEKFTYKGGAAQITLKAVGGPELAMELAEFDAQAVLLVSADASAFYGVKKPETMPNAPELFDEPEPTEEVDLEEAAEPAEELEGATA